MALVNDVKCCLFLRTLLSAQCYMVFKQNSMRRLRLILEASACLLVFTLGYSARGLQVHYGYYLDGQPVKNLATPDTIAVVLFFVATDCPLSNRYIPEVDRLESKYAARHVVFWFVYPNAGESSDAIRRHEIAYGTEAHLLLDPDHQLVKLTHVNVTPESAILVTQNNAQTAFRSVYHGRIDDRYIQLGQQRPAATQHDLERALEEVLEHRSVQNAGGPAIGCGIIGQP